MIEKLTNFSNEELDQLAEIWLAENLQAHSFIPASHWEKQFKSIKELLPTANIYAYKNDDKIVGFVGEADGYIAGLFVDFNSRKQGIGGQLINHLKELKETLTLSVYIDNTNAVHFYKNKDFIVGSEDIDADTNAKEYHMIWKQSLKK